MEILKHLQWMIMKTWPMETKDGTKAMLVNKCIP